MGTRGHVRPLQWAMSCGCLSFRLLPLCPPQSYSTFPSSLSRAAFCPPPSSSLFSGRPCFARPQHKLALPGVGCPWGLLTLPSRGDLPVLSSGVMAWQLGQESGRQETLLHSFYLCLLFTSPSHQAVPILHSHLSPSILACSCSSAEPAKRSRGKFRLQQPLLLPGYEYNPWD